ncbi:MAG: hypothetical protein ACK4YP_06985 [Myxococcota bacterium]
MVLVLLAAALADVRFERVPEKVETEDLGPIPMEDEAADRKKWLQDAAVRAGLAALDGAVRWRADGIDACARLAGLAAGTVAKVDVTVGVDGAVKAKPRGDDPLAGCVVTALDGQVFPVIVSGDVRGKFTVTYTPSAAPEAGATAPAARVDEERGFAGVAWGEPSERLENGTAVGSHKGTTFYARRSDLVGRWLGAKVTGASYAFGKDGLHSVRLSFVGTTTAWRVREALTARYGAPDWDNGFGAYFWRGANVLLLFRPVPGSEEVQVSLLDIARARASGLADRMPGDPVDPTKSVDGRRLPRIFQDDAK